MCECVCGGGGWGGGGGAVREAKGEGRVWGDDQNVFFLESIRLRLPFLLEFFTDNKMT